MLGNKIGKRIKLARIERDWTKTQLAEASGLSQKSISTYEKGKTIIPLKKLIRICTALGVKTSKILVSL